MPLIDAQLVARLFADGDEAETSAARGKALEDAIAYLFEQIPGVSVTARNVLSADGAQEIDIAVWNEGDPDGLRFFDHVLLIECKNWQKRVGHEELSYFADKLRSRGRPFGVFVAANGITGDSDLLSRAHSQIARSLEHGREIVVLTREEILGLGNTDELVVLLKRKRLQLVVSGTSI